MTHCRALFAAVAIIAASTGCSGSNGGGGPDAGGGPPATAALTGSIAGGSYAFAVQPVGAPSEPLTWTVTNGGDATSGALSVAISGEGADQFSDETTCSGTLDAGESCTVTVTFNPGSPGDKAASLSVAASPGGTVTLALTGSSVWRLTVTVEGGGTVSSDDGKISACTGTCSADYDAETAISLSATTTNGSDAYFTGWTGTPCSGPARACPLSITGNAEVTARFGSYATSGNLAFISSSVLQTNLGSSAATYDDLCNSLATAAGINDAAGDLYIAWISTSATGDGPALSRLGTNDRGWVRLDGRILADDQASFINATSPAWLNPVVFDESGAPITDTPYLLTGTTSDGQVGQTCSGWSTGGSGYQTGSSHGGGVAWTDSGPYTCTTDGRLLCMMTGRAAPLTMPAPPEGAKKIFLTNNTYAPDPSITPDDRCDGELAGSIALVATTTTTAASKLDPNAVYVRPDGVVVGTGAQIAAGTLESGIWEYLNGSYAIGSSLSYSPWTGSANLTELGTADSTCDDWTSTTASGNPTIGDASTTFVKPSGPVWWNYGGGGCFQARAYYCFET